ncbi:MAG: 4Fe-4S dicluster domain-containing protein [Candidatus Tectomicrobia bacterium]|uniref:4Fe-4S dicluster domain-containing protein n=1 Tax=Tectimicrobiota bacterium TaxID=2528274 RepID=A0A932M1K0_UNCTE|nr:4Fe-4S dicluster domain-containing protein [Candidatus Tectomicrobia bacterium]
MNGEKSGTMEEFINVADFNERIVGTYNAGTAEEELPADLDAARSLIAPGTGTLRDFSYIAPEMPRLIAEKCVGCMECVVACPDTAILGRVVSKSTLEKKLADLPSEVDSRILKSRFAETTKYFGNPEKKGEEGGYFGIFVDPTKCKGCGECVEVCGDHLALEMIRKTPENLDEYRRAFAFFRALPPTPERYIQEKVLADMMLADRSLLFVGGAGSCMGCGEATGLRMMLAATGFVYGPNSVGLVAATGCNTVYGSTYPYNPFLVPWSNSLFENVATLAMGVRARWDQMGYRDKKLWAIGGDGAMLDIGFQALSRLFMSGMNVNVIVLDTQVYSNTGGQTSTSSFLGQDAKMSMIGSAQMGKLERRKELGNIAMMHPDVYVAQTTPAHINHFYRAIMTANEYPGPALVNVYSTCQPEHGVADDQSFEQARMAVDSRAFPIFIHDPRKGPRLQDRLSLQGNPAQKEDWYKNPKTGEIFDFVAFARTERRFAKQFKKDGTPSETLLKAQEDRLSNWRLLQELAGFRAK